MLFCKQFFIREKNAMACKKAYHASHNKIHGFFKVTFKIYIETSITIEGDKLYYYWILKKKQDFKPRVLFI